MSELVVLLGRQRVGVVTHDEGRLSFRYADAWRSSADAYPLSLSMPLTVARHGHAAIEPFLWGLLSDDRLTLEAIAREYHVSPGNVFRMLEYVGEDCAGAVQVVPPERVDQVTAEPGAGIRWLTKTDLHERLRQLQRGANTGRWPDDPGRFSLAGVQPKTALLRRGRRWGVPSGSTPTTHIIKVSRPEFPGIAENEHLCMTLARKLGMVAPATEVLKFEGGTAIVVERYDRSATDSHIRRIHQEDMCQALGRYPRDKYQAEGGPTPAQIIALLRRHSTHAEQDVARFVDALIFNWVVGGTDAHGKNYGVMIAARGQVRLAPMYDVASYLPYVADRDYPRMKGVKLAMKVGNEYGLTAVRLKDWGRLADACELEAATVIARARELAGMVEQGMPNLCGESGLASPPVARLCERVHQRAAALR